MTFPHKILRELKPNWDSYGAPAIDGRCIEKAFELWRHLPHGDWQVVPCNDGGVQIEQHRDGFDIEITVSPASTPETPPEYRFQQNPQGGDTLETRVRPAHTAAHDCACKDCVEAETVAVCKRAAHLADVPTPKRRTTRCACGVSPLNHCNLCD